MDSRIEGLVSYIERCIRDCEHHDSFMSYFSKNIPQYEKFYPESNSVDEMISLTFDGDAAPYIMKLSTVIRQIAFHLKSNISLLDESIGDHTEIMYFTFASNERHNGDGKLLEKNYINENGAFYEMFDPQNGKIQTRIYDRNEVLGVISDLNEQFGFRYCSDHPFVDGTVNLSKTKPLFTVEVTWANGCRIKLKDSEDNMVESVFINSDSLYEAYYGYMVRKGYFYDGSQKKDTLVFVKDNGEQ